MTNEEIIAYLDDLPQDRYVLHGTKERFDVLEPAFPNQPHLIQQYNLCAVYGTLFTDVALLYAVIHEDNQNWGWEIGSDTPHLSVVGPRRMQGGIGYVHILKRSDFTEVIEPGLACLAFSKVSTLETVEVQPDILMTLQTLKRIRFS